MDKNFRIKDMPLEDRPQEKMLMYGPNVLSNAELIALIIRTGSKNKTSIEVSQDLLNNISFIDDGKLVKGISGLKNLSLSDLLKIDGIGKSKACMIMAAITLATRMNRDSVFGKVKITSPEKMANFVMCEMSSLKTEEFRVAILNTKKEIESIRTIFSGTIDRTIVHPREVYKYALEYSAHSIIAIHNHPSGDSTPSKDDIELTKRLVESGKILGIELVDHLIIGSNKYYSFLENGLF